MRQMAHTSIEAYESVKPHLPTIQDKILQAIKAAGDKGISSHELVEKTGVLLQTVSGSLRKLQQDGLIDHNGEYALSPSGRRARRMVAL